MSIVRAIIAMIFGNITKLIFDAVTLVYDLLYDIANTTLFSGTGDGSIGSFGHNIYTILGVIMLFKLAFSLITYIANPDAFSDRTKGFGAMVKNVVFVIGLTLLVPIIFEQAMNLQRIVLKEDIIGRVITGVSREGGKGLDSSAGQTMAFNLLAGFVVPTPAGCENFSSLSTADKNTCMNTVSSINDEAAFIYTNAYNTNDFKGLLDYDVLTAADNNDDELFHFDWLLAPLVGGFTFYILLLFCIDIAVRSVKLVFYQLIAPIPIVSYIDPKGQSGVFKKWVNMCVTTYLDLFIRLAAIYLAIYLISTVVNGEGMQTIVTNAAGDSVYEKPRPMVRIFITLGCLMFAKELPKIISDITGMKLDGGGFTLNPTKKIAGAALGGAAIASGMNLAGRTSWNLAKGVGNLARGDTRKARANLRAGINDVRGTVTPGIIKKWDNSRVSKFNKLEEMDKKILQRAEQKIKDGEAGALSDEYLTKLAEMEAIQNRTVDKTYVTQVGGRTVTRNKSRDKIREEEAENAREYAQKQVELNALLKESKYKYVNDVKNGKIDDAGTKSLEKDMDIAAAASGVALSSDAKTRHGQIGDLTEKKEEIVRKQNASQEAREQNK